MPARPLAGAVPYLKLFGTVAGGWLMARAAAGGAAALARGDGDPAFNQAKLLYGALLRRAYPGHRAALLPAIRGGGTVMSFDLEQF